MPYTQILKRAFNVVRHEPALWIVGIIFAFFGGGGGGGGGGMNFNGAGDFNLPEEFGGDAFNQIPFEGGSPDFSQWMNPETLLPLALFLACLLIGWIIFAFIMRNVALAGLIYGADRAAQGQDVRWSELLRVGWSQKGVRLMALNFLLALPALLIVLLVLIIGVMVGFTFFQALMAGEDPGIESIGVLLGGFGVLVCIGLLMALLMWIIGLIGNYAARFIVLEEHSVMDGLREGWQLFRNNIADTIVFAIILTVLSFILSFIVGVIIIMAALLMIVPMVLLLTSQDFSLMLTIGLAIPGILLLILLVALLSGPMLAYFETTWTLVWQHLTQGDDGEIPLEPAAI